VERVKILRRQETRTNLEQLYGARLINITKARNTDKFEAVVWRKADKYYEGKKHGQI
jgi:hypothetical protein